MTASERFGPRCRRLTLEQTTSGAVDPRLQVQPKFCLRKAVTLSDRAAVSLQGGDDQRDDHLHTVGSFVPAVTDRVTSL